MEGATTIGPAKRVIQSFAPDPDAAVRAAQTLDLPSPDLPAESLDAVRWIIFELVSNSLKYSGVRPDETIDVLVEIRGDATRIEVRDPGFFDRSAPPRNPRGWGLHVIAQLADRWGVSSSARTPTTVWVEITRGPMTQNPLTGTASPGTLPVGIAETTETR